MKRVGIREFRAHISRYLKELPVTLTHHNRDLAVVKQVENDLHPLESPTDLQKQSADVKASLEKKIQEKNPEKAQALCEHGAMKGLCKVEGCKNYMFK